MGKRKINLIICLLLIIGNISFHFLTTGSEYAYDVSIVFGVVMTLLLLSPLIGYIYLTIKEWDS